MDHKLFRVTFSAVHASEELLSEVLEMSNEKKTKKFGQKAIRHILIAAIITALLAVTAFAASEIYDTLQVGQIMVESDSGLTPTDDGGNSYEILWHDIHIGVAVNADAPTAVTEFYLPEIPAGYIQYHGYLYKDNRTAQYFWKTEADYLHDIRFDQEAAGSLDNGQFVITVCTKPGEEPEVMEAEFAGIEGYLAKSEVHGGVAGFRMFCWCDGDYLFRLEVPYDYTDAQLEEMVKSITQVKNIRPYLIGMTQEEKDEALGGT